MKKFAIIAGFGFMALGGAALAQPSPYSGTPGSLFPDAAPHEVRFFNGVPCRTILDPSNRNTRIPIACAGGVAVAPMAAAPMTGDVVTTGSIAPAPMGPMMVAPGPALAADPYAAPHEVRTVNGVPCRTVYDPQTGGRIPVACGR